MTTWGGRGLFHPILSGSSSTPRKVSQGLKQGRSTEAGAEVEARDGTSHSGLGSSRQITDPNNALQPCLQASVGGIFSVEVSLPRSL